jgi:TolB-like protein
MRLLNELKRRNVVRVAVVYAATAFVVLQAAELMLPRLGVPDWTLTLILLLLLLGFPIALVMAWALELTPEGIRRSQPLPHDEPAPAPALLGKRTLLLAGGLVLLGIGLGAGWLLQPATAPAPAPAVAGERQRSIAVLPFADLSAAGDQQYFADGLAEEILNLLAGVRDLRVTGRTSSFSFRGKDVPIPEIGRTLGVAHVLDGSVRIAGERLRVTAQLIEAGTGFQVWSETFERRTQDIFVIQDEIAGAIARALEVSLVGKAATTDLEVYDLYLRARALVYERRPEGLQQARRLIDDALALDPDFPPALATSGELWLLLAAGYTTYGDIPEVEAHAAARALLERALALDPELADAHAAMGLLATLDKDDARARGHLNRALALNPSHASANNWLAGWYSARGEVNAALEVRRRFDELDPLFAVNVSNLGFVLADAGRLEEAAEIAARVARSFPGQAWAPLLRGYIALMEGRLAEAMSLFEQALALAGNVGVGRFHAELTLHALGDFRDPMFESTGYLATIAPVARGEIELGLARGRGAVRAAPGNPVAAVGFLEALSLAGRHEEILAWVEERWQDIHGMDAYFGPNAGAGKPLIPVAAALRAAGRDEEFADAMTLIRDRVVFLRENGVANPWIAFVDASRAALDGTREDALAALRDAIDAGMRNPVLFDSPAFLPWAGDPEFAAEFDRMRELINIERRQLGIAPLA